MVIAAVLLAPFVLVAVPNIAVGADPLAVSRVVAAVRCAQRPGQALLLDVHTDPDHDRTVFTLAGGSGPLLLLLEQVFRAVVQHASLGATQGVHPRVGLLDVVPFVATGDHVAEAVGAAVRLGARLAEGHGLPVFRYGTRVEGPRARLVTYRRQAHRMADALRTDLPPDHGPPWPHPRAGAACVGARPPMVAYNLDVQGPLAAARTLARELRAAQSGLAGVEALAFHLPLQGRTQLSFNLRSPLEAGPAAVYSMAQGLSGRHGLRIGSAEVVGLPPAETIPDPLAAGLPARTRTLEAALEAAHLTD